MRVVVGAGDAELVSDLLWFHGATAIAEVPAGDLVALEAGFATVADAGAAAAAVGRGAVADEPAEGPLPHRGRTVEPQQVGDVLGVGGVDGHPGTAREQLRQRPRTLPSMPPPAPPVWPGMTWRIQASRADGLRLWVMIQPGPVKSNT